MKILYLSGFILPSRAAHGVHVMRMCQALANNGHQVTLFAWGRREDRTQDVYGYYGVANTFSLTLLPIVRVRGGTLFSLPRLYRELRTYNPGDTLVYARSIYGASLAARMGFRIVYEAHCPPTHALIYWLERRLLEGRNLQKLIVISESLRRIYLSRFGPLRQIEVCHDAADVPSTDGAVYYPWANKAGALQIGYTGHLFRGRGIEIILECARRLPQEDFHIVGGTDADVDHWRRVASTLPNVKLWGFMCYRDAEAIRLTMDVLLAPYQRKVGLQSTQLATTEKWMSPLKLFEYMAASKPIICSDIPVLREILTHRESVLFCAPDDVEGWVNALVELRDSPDLRRRLACKAFAEFAAKYTWRGRAERVLVGI